MSLIRKKNSHAFTNSLYENLLKQEIHIKPTIDGLIFAGILNYHDNERKTMFETGCHHLLKLET